MNKSITIIAVFLVLTATPNLWASPITGNQLKQQCAEEDGSFNDGACYGLVIGVQQMLGWVSDTYSICLPEGVTRQQTVSIVKKLLEEQPQNLHMQADQLVTAALVATFPCPDE